jgi:multidrug efflux pump subunit AcrA (membrane-fusion protein)
MPRLFFWICFWLAFIPAQPVHAEQEIVTAQGAVQPVTLTGFTRPRTVIDLSSEEAGKVTRVFADIGDRIADAGYFACLDRTFIDLEIASNRAEMGRVKVEIDFFSKQVSRYRTLVGRNSVAQMQLDETERSLASFQRQSDALKIEERRLQERKRRFCIAAPPGWLVIDREIEVGEWLDVGQQVGRVGDFSSLLIPYALSLPEIQALWATKHLTVRLPELDKTVAASLERVSPNFDEQSHKIKLDLEIGGRGLRGGLRTELMLKIPDASGAVLIAKNALEERYEQYWLQTADGKEIRVVYLGDAEPEGADDAGLVRIVSPEIQPGDRFIVNGR